MARWLALLVYLALAGATAATAALVAPGEDDGARAQVLAAAGDFELTNSEDGQPIFSAAGIGPGDSASGTVRIGASGSAVAELVLSRHDLIDTPGPGGGALSSSLALRVTDVSASPELVYAGPLATMPPQPLGQLAPGDSRTYEFVATLPEGGPASDQNDLQGAALSVAYGWTASEAADPPAPPGDAPPPPAPPTLAPAPPDLRLAVTGIWRRPEQGLVLVRAACNRTCAIALRGELRVWDAAGQRSAPVALSRQPGFASGRQQLAVRIPAGLRSWLRAHPTGVWARAELVLRARDEAGERDAVRRAPWLRHPRWAARLLAVG